MAKSLRSKWKRKMRAIKREKMDVKVLTRMNKMLVASVAEQKLDAQEEKLMQKRKLQKEGVAEEVIEAKLAAIDPPIDATAVSMEVQEESDYVTTDEDAESVTSDHGRPRKLQKPNMKTMRNEKYQFPVWMSTKKIKYTKRLLKKTEKRTSKEAKKIKQWKRACAS
ncbi:protein LLP homolog [Daphnia pulex]|uniref:protein LLP homolog n=1 Tax=Daphnia pulex TaxID=6669 RepID=UPI001EDEB3FB|nr:protein LLP homolog [Daphnia pulex]